MGIAAYNRGTRAIREQIASQQRAPEFVMMDHLNSLAKYPDAGVPFGPIDFQFDGKMWWALDPKKGFSGFGFYYRSLREAVRRWHVSIVGYENGVWKAVPRTQRGN